MFAAKVLEDISARISEAVAASPARDVEKNVKALLTSALSRMDLVTREEFEVQKLVLQRAREKIEALSARITELESKQP